MTEEGLSTTIFDDYRSYVWRANDTWTSVADRYYGNRRRASLLRVSNEGVEPEEGETILVPVVDLASEAGRRASHEPQERRESGGEGAESEESSRLAGWSGRTHTTADGDRLWSIAKDFYGKGSRWMDIYDANRDVLDDPDSLPLDVVLRIPD